MNSNHAQTDRHQHDSPAGDATTPTRWHDREDECQQVWAKRQNLLELNPGPESEAVGAAPQRRVPGRLQDSHLRALQPEIEAWQAVTSPPNEGFSGQVHRPGQLGVSEFFSMDEAGITLAGQPFDHMIYHYVLPCSNWETGTVCFSESFESFSHGLQKALWELGGVPEMHRFGRPTGVDRADNASRFKRRYRILLAHYGLAPQAKSAREERANGDATPSDCRLKRSIDQALMLRGSRDFDDRAAYERFISEFFGQRNDDRSECVGAERSTLADLPARRMVAWPKRRVRVTHASTIRVLTNTYSVPSHVIDMQVDVYVMEDVLEVRKNEELLAIVPRLPGRNLQLINYQHLVYWFACNPGAFAAHRYRDAMFPTSRFRRAYEALLAHFPTSAAQNYVRILRMAVEESEAEIDAVLDQLLEWGARISPTTVEEHLHHERRLRRYREEAVSTVDWSTEYFPLANGKAFPSEEPNTHWRL
jgi:hypothetical protein